PLPTAAGRISRSATRTTRSLRLSSPRNSSVRDGWFPYTRPGAPTAIRCPSTTFDCRNTLWSLFYLFPGKKARLPRRDLSNWCPGICRRQIGQIAIRLLHRSQAVSHQKSLIDEETEIIRLQGHTAGRLAGGGRRLFPPSRPPTPPGACGA